MVLREGREGFTLLETLIAFVILSMALALSAQTIAIATRSLTSAKERTEVLQLVDTLRAETLPEVFRKGQKAEGTSRAYHWRIDLTLVASPANREGMAAFAVLTISTNSGRKHAFIFFNPGIRGIR